MTFTAEFAAPEACAPLYGERQSQRRLFFRVIFRTVSGPKAALGEVLRGQTHAEAADVWSCGLPFVCSVFDGLVAFCIISSFFIRLLAF